MYLEKIELQGFKSFAKKTIIDFSNASTTGKGIIVIVGPNGSGKSNIADAIRWVLGEQSMKNLRGKKSTDIIFSGSDQKARLGLAEVTLFINNEDKKVPINLSNVELTRRLYRSGESEYRINRHKVRLTDVALLLAKAHFGQKTYSVIGQGMIDAILLASSTDRKDFFDEAAGIKEFQIKRDMSISKLNLTINNLSQVETLLSEIEPRLKILTRQVKRLRQREKLETKLSQKQFDYYSILWNNYNTESTRIFTKHQEIIIQKTKKSDEIFKIQSELNTLEKKETDPNHSNNFEKLQKEYERLLNEKTSLREKELSLRNTLQWHQKIQEKSPLIKSIQDIINDLEKYINSLKKVESNLQKIQNIKDVHSVCSLVTRIRKNLIQYVAKLKNPNVIKQKYTQDPKLTKNLANITSEIEKKEYALKAIQEQLANYQKESTKSKGRVFELQRAFRARQTELNDISARLQEVEIEKTRVDTRKEDLEKEILANEISLQKIQKHKPQEKNIKELSQEIRSLKHRLELIGAIEPATIQEYKETKERFEFLKKQTKDLQKAITDLVHIINQLDKTIKKEFHNSFKIINDHFQKYFKILFGGGKASLILQKEEDRKDNQAAQDFFKKQNISSTTKRNISGIEIRATPPGKKLTNIHILSGGERALTSIALICAIIASNPSPFVVLDEVDAALDEVNSERFARILNELAHKTQFIVITHNRNTMEQAGLLYGITMGKDGVSRLLSIKLSQVPLGAKKLMAKN